MVIKYRGSRHEAQKWETRNTLKSSVGKTQVKS